MTSPVKPALLAIALVAGFPQMTLMAGIANSQSMPASGRLDVSTIMGNALRGDAEAVEWLQKMARMRNLRLMLGKPNPQAGFSPWKPYMPIIHSSAPVDVNTLNWLQSDLEIGGSLKVGFMDSESTLALGKPDKLAPESVLLANMKSTDWLQQAARQGNLQLMAEAVNPQASLSSGKPNLLEVVAKARGGDRESINWLEAEAEKGNLQASYELGLLYEKGQGVEQDSGAASQLYQQTIERGAKFLARGIYRLRTQ